jgi:nucleoside-diphosphate-sugar epimerase
MIFVTGSTGFVGHSLLNFLNNDKVRVSSRGEENQLRKNKTFEKVDKKKVMEDFAKEGGAIRPLSRSVTQPVKRRKGQKDG